MTDVDEAELAAAWSVGLPLDCRDADGAPRRVDAQLIRRFCVQRAADVDPRGVGLVNAIVVGVLDLTGVEVAFPLWLEACEFDSAPILHGARLGGLYLTDCPALPGLLANGLKVRRDLDLSRSRITGEHSANASLSGAAVWLSEAEIGGRFICRSTVIEPADQARAIHADRIRVAGSVFMRDFVATGEVRLLGARIEGSLDLLGVRIEAARVALDLGDAVVGESVFLVENDRSGAMPVITGIIDLAHARVIGTLLIRHATLRGPAEGPIGRYDSLSRRGWTVNAPWLSVSGRLLLEGNTTVSGGLDLASAELGGLRIDHPATITAPGRTALDLTNAEVRSGLRLVGGVKLAGTVRLDGARIRGDLHLVGATLSQPEGSSLLEADGATIDGDVDLHHLQADGGELKFWRSTLESGIDATDAQLRNPGKPTLRLHQATVKGSVRLVSGFSSLGYVMLNRSVIEGRVDLTDGSFECDQPDPRNPEQHAIQAVATVARGGMALGWRRVEPSVDFTDASTSVLEDDPTKWPSRFRVSGLSYQRFDAPRGANKRQVWEWRPRREWLRHQIDFDAGPFEQAARVLRQHGYTYAAEQILIAQRADARVAHRDRWVWYSRGLDVVYGWSVGYGYRPGRVLWLLALLLALVSATLFLPAAQGAMRAEDERGVVYGTTGVLAAQPGGAAEADACGDGHVRCFDPILYAVDTVVPLVALDQRATWYPNPHVSGGVLLQWWLNIATVIGWLLSSIFLLSFARMARAA